MTIETPSISVSKYTNEQNIQILKNYLSEMADILNIYMARIDSLEDKINSMESEES